MRRARGRRLLVALVLAGFVGPGTAPGAAASDPVPTWAYYYIWYQATSWTRAKADYPLLGRYSSDEPSVMRRHIELARRAGIDGFIVSWKSTPVLDRRLTALASIAAKQHFRLAIIYQGLDFHRRPLPVQRVAADLARFARIYAKLAAFRVAGKPLVVWSGTWEFSAADLGRVTSRYRDRLRILASERDPAAYRRKAAAFDGNAYYWSSVNPWTNRNHPVRLRAMARAVHDTDGIWLAPAAPGFDGSLVGHPTVVPRRDGDTLRRSLDVAAGSSPDAIAVISWNEFSENSHVEPSVRYGTRALEVLADVAGTRFRAEGELDSSLPAGRAGPRGAIPSMLVLIVAGTATVLLLGRRRRRHGVR
jgi:hypothetical protein